MKIEHALSPDTKDIDFLTQKINEENADKGTAYPFAFFTKDDRGEIIAGCNGSVIYGAIYTDQLWVHPDYRKLGFGRKLMEKIHNYGRKAGCSMATVATMSFQEAQSFYEHLGYECDFQRPGYAGGAYCLFLRKVL